MLWGWMSGIRGWSTDITESILYNNGSTRTIHGTDDMVGSI